MAAGGHRTGLYDVEKIARAGIELRNVQYVAQPLPEVPQTKEIW